jgi:hypothetical protein
MHLKTLTKLDFSIVKTLL